MSRTPAAAPVSVSQLRRRVVYFRTAAEIRQVERAAKADGISVSLFLRQAALRAARAALAAANGDQP